MKVGFDVAQTCVPRAGCAWHADSLGRALAPILGPENLILYHQFGDWINANTDAGTQIPACSAPLSSLDDVQASYLWRKIESNQCICPGNPDILHSNSFMAPKIESLPLVYTVHDLCFLTHPQFASQENRKLCSDQIEIALKFADAFHFISESTYQDFESQFPGYLKKENKPHKIILSGPRIKGSSKPREFSNQDKQSHWLFVGTIMPRKNIEGLLDAFELYIEKSDSPRPLEIIGGQGWQSEHIHQRIQSLAETGLLHYRGYVDEEQLRQSYRHAFGFIFPSHYEGFGLPVMEAMSFGLPVVANQIPSIQEFAACYADLVDFEKPSAVANSMHQLDSNPTLYNRQSTRSLSAAQNLSWEKTASEMLEFYHEILARSKTSQNTRGLSTIIQLPPRIELRALKQLEQAREIQELSKTDLIESFPTYQLGKQIQLTTDDSNQYLFNGWYEAEENFRWAAGPFAEIILKITNAESNYLLLELELVQLPHIKDKQRIALTINGTQLESLSVNEIQPIRFKIPIKQEPNYQKILIRLGFRETHQIDLLQSNLIESRSLAAAFKSFTLSDSQ